MANSVAPESHDRADEVTFSEQVDAAARWLAGHARPSRRRPDSSYRLKHLVQAASGHYVSSRAVVVAATAAGYRIVGRPTPAGNALLALHVVACAAVAA